MVAAPREAAQWEGPPAERRAQAAKQASVAAAELDKLRLASGGGGGPLLGWLAAPLVESLQLELADVHLRFQEASAPPPSPSPAASAPCDASSQEPHRAQAATAPAALGLRLQRLVVRTTESGSPACGAPPPLQRQLATPAPRHCRPRTSWWRWWA